MSLAFTWVAFSPIAIVMYHRTRRLMNEKPTNLELAVRRLRDIHWVRDYFSRESHDWLLDEYVRRAAVWNHALRANVSSPFLDLAYLVAPGLRADDSTLEMLIKTRGLRSRSAGTGQFCEAYLHWANLPEHIRAQYSHLPDLFEPLLKFFERGGLFTTHHGDILIGGGMHIMHGWQKRFDNPARDISDAALAILDGPTAPADSQTLEKLVNRHNLREKKLVLHEFVNELFLLTADSMSVAGELTVENHLVFRTGRGGLIELGITHSRGLIRMICAHIARWLKLHGLTSVSPYGDARDIQMLDADRQTVQIHVSFENTTVSHWFRLERTSS